MVEPGRSDGGGLFDDGFRGTDQMNRLMVQPVK